MSVFSPSKMMTNYTTRKKEKEKRKKKESKNKNKERNL